MNDKQITELRKQYKDGMISNFKKIAEFYNSFAEKIKNDELISDNENDELTKLLCEKITFINDDGKTEIMYMNNLFESYWWEERNKEYD